MTPLHKAMINNLIPFLERLRGQGYSISTHQIMSAHWLLSSMAERGSIPEDPAQLADWLGPILCTTPRQQTEFPKQFERWLKSLERRGPADSVEPTSLIQSYNKKVDPIRNRGFLLIALALLVFVAGASWWIWGRPSKVKAPVQQVAAAAPPVQAEARTVIQTINSTIPATLCLAGGVVFIVSSGFWLITKRAWAAVDQINRKQLERQIARLVTRKRESDESVGLELRIQAESPWSPTGKGAYRQAVPALLERTGVSPHAQTLNVKATVDRWIRDEGRFEPVYSTRKVTPEYLALIDRISANDHQAEWAEAMLDTLSDAQVSITRYEFARDPRSCRPLRGPSRDRSFSLRDLAERFPDHRLLIFTNGEALIDPRRAQPAAWLERFAAWPERVIFTFRPRSTWGAFEHGLIEAGFQVCPSTPRGIAEVSRSLAGWNHRTLGSSNESVPVPIRPIPKRLREEPERWIDSHPPEPWEIVTMLDDLRLYLDEDYPWFAACAVYPELRWDLTRELGRVVFAEEDQTDTLESGLALLTRLPWFREGSMPDWLRLRLLGELDKIPGLKDRVKNAIHQLIMGAHRVDVTRFDSGKPLAALMLSTSQPLAKTAEQVRQAAVQLDATSTWADPVLSHFLEPQSSNALEFELPRNVIQSLVDPSDARQDSDRSDYSFPTSSSQSSIGPNDFREDSDRADLNPPRNLSQPLAEPGKNIEDTKSPADSHKWIPDWLLGPLSLFVALLLVCIVVPLYSLVSTILQNSLTWTLRFPTWAIPLVLVPLVLWGLHLRSGWRLGRQERLSRWEVFLAVVCHWFCFVLLFSSIFLGVASTAAYRGYPFDEWVVWAFMVGAPFTGVIGIVRTIIALMKSATAYASRIHKSLLMVSVVSIAIGLLCQVALYVMSIGVWESFGSGGVVEPSPAEGLLLPAFCAGLSLSYELVRHWGMRQTSTRTQPGQGRIGQAGDFRRNFVRALAVIMAGSFAAVLLGILWITFTPEGRVSPSDGRVNPGSERPGNGTPVDPGQNPQNQENLPATDPEKGQLGAPNSKDPTGSEKDPHKSDPPPYGDKGKDDTSSDFKQVPPKRPEKPKS